jgi:hypothetical protein
MLENLQGRTAAECQRFTSFLAWPHEAGERHMDAALQKVNGIPS